MLAGFFMVWFSRGTGQCLIGRVVVRLRIAHNIVLSAEYG